MKKGQERHLIDMSYDVRFRKRTIEYHEEGNSIRKTAKIFGITKSTLEKWLKQQRETGDLNRKYRTYQTAINEEELLSYLELNPSAYQTEIAEHFGCHRSAVSRAFKRCKITRKKR